MKSMRSLALVVCLACAAPVPGVEAPTGDGHRFYSGPQRVSLVELYTSEGCSSCPPADRWLSTLKRDARLWERIVPVAFHVDYWDYIGWEDRFARPEYGERQSRYAQAGRARTVYTPGFFTNGEEWAGFFTGQPPPLDDAPVGVLELSVDGNYVAARFEPRYADYGPLTLHVVLLGMGRESSVDAGENRGRTLRHDFVVLNHQFEAMHRAEAEFECNVRLPDLESWSRPLAVAAWITEDGDLTPVQAVGGPL